MQTAVREAGELIMSYFQFAGKIDTLYKTSHADIITEVDLASQRVFRQLIKSLAVAKGFTDDEIGFLGEENLDVKGKNLFIIDPIDGTTNFAAGLDYFSLSVGYYLDGEPKAGVIYNPVNRTMYLAEKGKGAWVTRNGLKKELKLERFELKDCLLAAHYNIEAINELLLIYKKLMPDVRGNRSMGSLVLDLGYFMENVFNLVVNGNCYIWDLAAAKLIIEEAGGAICDWHGSGVEFDFNNTNKTYKIIAGHPLNLARVVEYFR